MKKIVLLIITHAAALAVGFAAGIYVLPIITAPPAPDAVALERAASDARYRGTFRRDLRGSDFLHWGEGQVTVSRSAIALDGRIAPGPNYKLYLTPQFVETRDDFIRIKSRSAQLGDVKTFENFIVPVPASVDIEQYDTVVVWCESFSQFITAARYR